MLGSKTLSICCFYILQFRITLGFNLDFEFPVLKKGPNGTLFGFAVAGHKYRIATTDMKNKILVSAPKGQNSFQKGLKSPGTVYSCDADSPSTTCEGEVPFDKTGNQDNEEKSNQWFGVSLKSGGIDKRVMACAHRYIFKTNMKNFHLFEGACRVISKNLKTTMLALSPCRNHNYNLAGDDKSIPSYLNYGYCLAGIGADIDESKNERKYYIGTVGTKVFSGSVFEVPDGDDDEDLPPITETKENIRLSFLGFSLCYGSFLKKQRIEIASGAPRTDSIGKVIVFTKEKGLNQTVMKELQSLPSPNDKVQFASSFGFAVCSIDFDKDGYSELLVGAPFYAHSTDTPGQGMVYYYKNDGKGKLVLKAKLTAKGARLNFGSAIASAGDLDLDGYNDLVIGAPYEESGKGAVYIYRGSANGLIETVAQKILASKVASSLLGFGRSLSGGLDLDANGYADVLVGAYASDNAVLLRSRPVIDIKTSFLLRSLYIDTSKKDIKIEGKNTTSVRFRVCKRFVERSGKVTGQHTVKFKLVADPGIIPRLKFRSTEKNILEIDHPVSSTDSCFGVVSYLVYNDAGSIAVYPDIKLVLTYKLLPDSERKPSPTPGAVTSLDNYAVLPPALGEQHATEKMLQFDRGCRPCIPDLVVETEENRTISLGTGTYPFNVTLRNKGPHPAYSVSVVITLPQGIALSKVHVGKKQVQCGNPADVGNKRTSTVCSNLYNEFTKGSVGNVSFILDTKSLNPFNKDNDVSVNFTSTNPEKLTLDDNALTTPLTIKANADLAIQGSHRTRQEFYGGKIKGESAIRYDDEIGHVVEHRYYVLNYGPDLLPSAIVTIHWPSVAVSGKHLLYLIKVQSEDARCHLKPGQVNELNYRIRFSNKTQASSRTSAKRKRRDVESTSIASSTESEANVEPTAETKVSTKPSSGTIKDSEKEAAGKAARGGGKEGIVLDCRKKTAKCVAIDCEITNFRKGGNAYITFRGRIWNSTFLMDYHGRILTVVSYADVRVGSNVSYIKDENQKNNVAELFTVIRPDFPSKGVKKIAIWKIALAILAGVILLALLIFGLYKVGFFNRSQRKQIRKKEPDDADDTLLEKKR